jgi:hypothetical protein
MLRRICGHTKVKITEAPRKLNTEYSLPNVITVPMKLTAKETVQTVFDIKLLNHIGI